MSEPRLEPPDHDHRGVLVWRLAPGTMALSSAPVGGGWSEPAWLLNLGVDRTYARTDLDAHAAEVAERLGLTGPGVGLFTAAQVDRRRRGRARVDRASPGDEAQPEVVADATVGVSKPTWAADPTGGWNTAEIGDWKTANPDEDRRHGQRRRSPNAAGGGEPGTINAVIQVPVTLSPAAAVNAVITATEAKTQALIEAGIPGTGTASDAIVVLWPAGGRAEPFAGPRSPWGAPIAQACHRAVADAITAGLEVER